MPNALKDGLMGFGGLNLNIVVNIPKEDEESELKKRLKEERDDEFKRTLLDKIGALDHPSMTHHVGGGV